MTARRLFLSLGAAALLLGAAAAEPLTADLLPPALLEGCEAQAAPLARAAPPIAAAAGALDNL
ncbi:MAG TPA: hypothetical protein DEA40_15265, partial [Parvularcula sp.]|nr:hypothetical protein [Parvularcula sp.]